jgi:hypothetical protein
LAIVITVTCEGLDHRLEFRDDGEVVMLDHSEKLVRSFVAFGAKPPECMEQIDKARDDPIWFLTEHLSIDREVHALLACDFAEHVLPIWYEYYKDDDSPKKAIHAARGYLVGKIEISTLIRARSAAWAAYSAARAAAWAAARAAEAAAASAARAAARAASASASASAAWAAADAAWAWESSSAAMAAYHHAEAHGDDPDAAKAAENKWQVARAVQVLEAVSRGEDPWRS